MTDDRKRIEAAGFWTGVEETPSPLGTCIFRTHPVKRTIAETTFLVILWSVWLVVCINSFSHFLKKGTILETLTFLSGPVFVWCSGALLVYVSAMALPQTLVFGPDTSLFTHIIGFERFGIRLSRPRSSIRGLLLVNKIWKRHSSTHIYVAWNGLGLPTMIAGCTVYQFAQKRNDYQIAQDHADYISVKTGIPRLSIDRQKDNLLRRLRSDGCYSVLLGIDILWVWHSKGSLPLNTYLDQVKLQPPAAVFFLGMSLVLFPIGVFDLVWTAFRLNRIRKQPRVLEDRRATSEISTR